MPNPYPILETYLSQGYSVEFSMGDDRWFYIVASHPEKGRVEAGGKTISDSVIMLDSRLKDRGAVELRNEAEAGEHTCPSCEGRGMRAYNDAPGLWFCFDCKGTGQV